MIKYFTVLLILINSFLGALILSPGNWDLGRITSNDGVQNIKIDLRNDTSAEVTINFISTCDCLISDTDTLNLSPDESSSVLFSFDPIDESGSVSKFIIIRTTQPGLPKALFEVFGDVEGGSDNKVIQTEDYKLSPGYVVIPIKYFYSAGCISCRRFLESTIPSLEEKLGMNLKIESLDILDPDVYEDFFSRLKPKEAERISFPALFIGEKLLMGEKGIVENLEYELLNYNRIERDTSDFSMIGEVSISIIPVIVAGLLDGINPCVFTTLLFLISTLT